MRELLEQLLEVPGISGYEDRVRDFVRTQLPEGVSTTTDAIGNLVVTLGSGGRDMLFAAHMDELGFVVSEVRDDGFLKLRPVGGIDPRTVFGRMLRIITESGELPGAVSVVPPHLMADRVKAMAEIPPVTDFLVDIGTSSRAETEQVGVQILDFAVIEKPFRLLNDKYFCARALDDRLGCCILLEALEEIRGMKLTRTVHFAFTVQEEVGLRGADTLGRTMNLDMAFAVDSASAGDFPGARRDLGSASLGAGPAFRVMDNRAIIPRGFTRELAALAEEENIPCQVVFTGGGTDMAAVQPSGAKVMPLCFPVRYTHSAVETSSVSDAENLVKFIATIVRRYAS